MIKGGPVQKPRSAKIFSFAGLFVPLILILYGITIQLGYIQIGHSINDLGFYIFYFWWILIGTIQFIYPSKSRLDSGLRLTAFHLLAGAYLIFISGIFSPITICWLILTLASYVYFSKQGLILNYLALIITIIIDIALWNQINRYIVFYDLLILLTIIITGLIIIKILRFQEISKKELQNSKIQESLHRDRVSTIVNNLADAVISTDIDGVIRVYNAASLSLIDTNISLNGHHIDDILPLSDEKGNPISLYQEFQKSKTVCKKDNYFYTFEADDKIRLEITFSPIKSSFSHSKVSQTHDGYIIIMRDITKAKSLEEERDEFISVISHELRTPITIAEGTISNVQVMMNHPDATNTMIVDAIDIAHQQIIFLASMVNDLSTLSRAERGVANSAEDIDIRELASDLHKKYSAEAKSKKLQLDLDIPTKIDNVHASRLYLEELLQNFITNAIKYTKKGSITIIIKQQSDIITFAIKDTGIGICKSDRQKIFDKFYRSEDYRTRETSGTGLGLYVSVKLATMLGTKIQLTSRLNFGSTFSFTLPAIK